MVEGRIKQRQLARSVTSRTETADAFPSAEKVLLNSVVVKALHFIKTSECKVRKTSGRCLGTPVQDLAARDLCNPRLDDIKKVNFQL